MVLKLRRIKFEIILLFAKVGVLATSVMNNLWVKVMASNPLPRALLKLSFPYI